MTDTLLSSPVWGVLCANFSRSHQGVPQNHGGMSPPSSTSAYPASNPNGASGSKCYAKPPPPNTGISPRSPSVDNNVSSLPPGSCAYHKKGKKYAGSQSPNAIHPGVNSAYPIGPPKVVAKKKPGEGNLEMIVLFIF